MFFRGGWNPTLGPHFFKDCRGGGGVEVRKIKTFRAEDKMFISCLKLGDGNVCFNSLYDFTGGKRGRGEGGTRGGAAGLFPFYKLQVLLKMSYVSRSFAITEKIRFSHLSWKLFRRSK